MLRSVFLCPETVSNTMKLYQKRPELIQSGRKRIIPAAIESRVIALRDRLRGNVQVWRQRFGVNRSTIPGEICKPNAPAALCLSQSCVVKLIKPGCAIICAYYIGRNIPKSSLTQSPIMTSLRKRGEGKKEPPRVMRNGCAAFKVCCLRKS